MADQLSFALSTDVAKAVAGLNKTVASQAEVIKKLRETQDAGKKTEEGMGALTGSFARFATVGGAVAGAVGLVKSVLGDMDRVAQSAADRIGQLERSIKSLVQISASAEEDRRLEALSKRISVSTGIKEAEAQNIVQRGLSLGISEPDIVRLSQAKQFEAEPGALLEAVGDIRGIFGPEIPSEAIVNALLAGQRPTKLGAAELSKLALAPAAMGKELGGSLAESVALTAIGVQGSKSATSGATEQEAFLKKLLVDPEKRFAGLGIQGALDKFFGLSREVQDQIIGGEKEALLGSSKMRAQRSQFTALVTQVEKDMAAAGTPQSPFEEKIRIAQANPRIAAMTARQRSEETLAIAEEQQGIEENIRDAVIARIKSELIERGIGGFARGFAGWQLGIEDFLNTSAESMIRDFTRQLPAKERESFNEEMVSYLKQIAVNTNAANKITAEGQRGKVVRVGELE